MDGPASGHRRQPAIAGLPRTQEIVLGNQIYVAKEGLVPALRNRLLRLAAFQNPEFYKAQAMRLPTYDKPRVVGCAEDHPQHIGLPRGCGQTDRARHRDSRCRFSRLVRGELLVTVGRTHPTAGTVGGGGRRAFVALLISDHAAALTAGAALSVRAHLLERPGGGQHLPMKLTRRLHGWQPQFRCFEARKLKRVGEIPTDFAGVV